MLIRLIKMVIKKENKIIFMFIVVENLYGLYFLGWNVILKYKFKVNFFLFC